MVQGLKLVSGVLVLAIAAGVLLSYGHRLIMPLPVYAVDEDAYAIRALFSDGAIARNAFVPPISNGLFLGIIRGVHAISQDYLPWLRLLSVAAYFGGLAALARVMLRGMAAPGRWTWLLVALAFPYYRFVVAGLPEGFYVGVLAAIAVATATLYRSRPVIHALASGALAAGLVLLKPHGVAVVGGLLGVAVLDGLIRRDLKTMLLRIAAFAPAFFVIGNAVQWGAGEGLRAPLLFFVGDFYGRALAAHLSHGAPQQGVMNLFAMTSVVLLFAGIPIVAGLTRTVRRWRAGGQAFVPDAWDLTFAFLLLSLAATLAMVAIYAMKVAYLPSEAFRLWGRYFEFFVPLMWLAAAPALQPWDPVAPRLARLAMAAVMLAGLAGLLLSFHWGVVLFPWDGTAVTAFFKADPARAAFHEVWPFRLIAVAATLAAAIALAMGQSVSRVSVLHVVAIGVLATGFDHSSIQPMIQQRKDMAKDIRDAGAVVRGMPGPVAGVGIDANEADLIFVGFEGRPQVFVWPGVSGDQARLSGFQTVVIGKDVGGLPPDRWTRVYHGRRVDVYARRPAPS